MKKLILILAIFSFQIGLSEILEISCKNIKQNDEMYIAQIGSFQDGWPLVSLKYLDQELKGLNTQYQFENNDGYLTHNFMFVDKIDSNTTKLTKASLRSLIDSDQNYEYRLMANVYMLDKSSQNIKIIEKKEFLCSDPKFID